MSNEIEKPSLSVITVTFNAGNTLARCIKSITDQSDQNFTHLVVDGASSDDSINILLKYGYKPFNAETRGFLRGKFFISERDSGMYEAMNKALNIATSSHVIFLNSDDYFNDKNVVARLINNLVMHHLQVYSIHYKEEVRERSFRPVCVNSDDVIHDKSLRRAPHPCIIFPVSDLRYDLRYKLASDYDFVIKNLLKYGHATAFNSFVTVMVRSEGQLSVKYRELMLAESKLIAENYETKGRLMINLRLLLWVMKNSIPILAKRLSFS